MLQLESYITWSEADASGKMGPFLQTTAEKHVTKAGSGTEKYAKQSTGDVVLEDVSTTPTDTA